MSDVTTYHVVYERDFVLGKHHVYVNENEWVAGVPGDTTVYARKVPRLAIDAAHPKGDVQVYNQTSSLLGVRVAGVWFGVYDRNFSKGSCRLEKINGEWRASHSLGAVTHPNAVEAARRALKYDDGEIDRLAGEAVAALPRGEITDLGELESLAAEAPSGEAILAECRSIARTLLTKNIQYGNSALEPVRVFSQASPREQILVRLDDKLSRIAKGKHETEDVILDLIGYLVLLRVSDEC